MNPRLRRIMADADAVRTEFAGHPRVQVIPIGAEPAEAYRIVFNLPGATLDAAGQPVISEMHQVVIQLPAAYPREKPIASTETPAFHPNFGPRTGDEICIGDFWTPRRTLTDIIVAIGEMIQYQRYNTKSPLNAVAARWAAANEEIFPLGTVSLFQSEPKILFMSVGDVESRGNAASENRPETQ
jgi:ubiquitin-protein ligase